MFAQVYLASPAADEADRARYVVQALVRAYLDTPSLLPPGRDDDVVTRVTDHVSGMTDRYALRAHRDLFVPHEGPL
jgi:dGTPase